jgi:hypothetical protein
MGKKSKAKALQKIIGREGEASDSETNDNDGGSTIGESTRSVDVKQKVVVSISEMVEKLSERRCTTREVGVELLIRHFQQSGSGPEDNSIDGFQETIVTYLKRAIKRPASIKEGRLCLQLLPLLGLYLGPDEIEFHQSFEKILKSVIENLREEFIPLRSEALLSLAMITFICGSVDAGYDTWNYCGRILCNEAGSKSTTGNVTDEASGEEEEEDEGPGWNESSSSSDDEISTDELCKFSLALRATAADCWVLLATLRSPAEVVRSCAAPRRAVGGDSEHEHRERGGLLVPLLELLLSRNTSDSNSGVDVRVSSGKMVAFLWEAAEAQIAVLLDIGEDSNGAAAATPASLLSAVPELVSDVLAG